MQDLAFMSSYNPRLGHDTPIDNLDINTFLNIFSGETNDKAIKPEVVENYWDLSKKGQLKFVVNGTKECWEEVEDVIRLFRSRGINYPIWIMPIGATEETQKEEAGKIATETLKRGYKVSARVHCYLWGNAIGV